VPSDGSDLYFPRVHDRFPSACPAFRPRPVIELADESIPPCCQPACQARLRVAEVAMSNSQTPQPSRNPLDRLFFLVVIAAGCLVLSNNIPDPDLWGHVQFGRDMLHDGLPATPTYTFTATGHPWVNHEILSEIFLATGVDQFGTRMMLMLKVLCGAALLTMILRRAIQGGANRLTAAGTVVLTAANLVFFWNLRPQLFSYLLFALLIALLEWCFAGWSGHWWLTSRAIRSGSEPEYEPRRMRYLWWACPLFFVWANTHGAFLAGLLIYGVYLGMRSIEALWVRGRSASGLVRRFALLAAAATAATMLNPYGPGLHQWLIDSVRHPRPEIVEWLPPETALRITSLAWIPFWILLGLTLLALVSALPRIRQRSGCRLAGNARLRPLDATQLVILAIVYWQAIEHRRHIALAAILASFWLPPLLDGLLSCWRLGQPNLPLDRIVPRRWKPVVASLLCVPVAAIAMVLWEQTRHLPVRRDLYPVTALQFIADHRLHGKLVVAFDWAQYAIMALSAENGTDRDPSYVHFDGRFDTCYPRRIIDQHFDFELGANFPWGRYRDPDSPPVDFCRVLEYQSPDLLLLHRDKSHAVQAVASSSARWVLLYQDQVAELWGSAARFDDASSDCYLPPDHRLINFRPQTGNVPWPALPRFQQHPTSADVVQLESHHHRKARP